MTRYFRLDVIMVALASFLVGVLGNFIANLLMGQKWWVYLILGVILVGVFTYLFFKKPVIKVHIGAPKKILDEADCAREARRGLVTFLTLHNPIKVPPTERLKPEEYLQAARNGEYHKLDFERSTFEPLIKALETHRCRLEHVWLIPSRGNPGSEAFAKPLIAYLQQEKGF